MVPGLQYNNMIRRRLVPGLKAEKVWCRMPELQLYSMTRKGLPLRLKIIQHYLKMFGAQTSTIQHDLKTNGAETSIIQHDQKNHLSLLILKVNSYLKKKVVARARS